MIAVMRTVRIYLKKSVTGLQTWDRWGRVDVLQTRLMSFFSLFALQGGVRLPDSLEVYWSKEPHHLAGLIVSVNGSVQEQAADPHCLRKQHSLDICSGWMLNVIQQGTREILKVAQYICKGPAGVKASVRRCSCNSTVFKKAFKDDLCGWILRQQLFRIFQQNRTNITVWFKQTFTHSCFLFPSLYSPRAPVIL